MDANLAEALQECSMDSWGHWSYGLGPVTAVWAERSRRHYRSSIWVLMNHDSEPIYWSASSWALMIRIHQMV